MAYPLMTFPVRGSLLSTRVLGGVPWSEGVTLLKMVLPLMREVLMLVSPWITHRLGEAVGREGVTQARW